jgi:hypothetical protein
MTAIAGDIFIAASSADQLQDVVSKQDILFELNISNSRRTEPDRRFIEDVVRLLVPWGVPHANVASGNARDRLEEMAEFNLVMRDATESALRRSPKAEKATPASVSIAMRQAGATIADPESLQRRRLLGRR